VSQPDLFVVCKNCGSEVSPYVTECPYCGQRVRKRAPKLDRDGTVSEPRQRRRRKRAKLPRLRSDEIAGIAPDRRPYATGTLVIASLLATLALAASVELVPEDLGGIVPGISEDPWRFFAAPFVYSNLGYQFVALTAAVLFGTMLERRFGPLPVVLVFVLAGAAGAALATVADIPPPFDDPGPYAIWGGNGAALGLLAAWLVDDRRATGRGEERENDLLGVYVIAAVLVLLSLAVEEANIVAAAGGAAVGALLGLALPLFTRRTDP
jgi:membrane associated rhomboid family serine protease